VIGLARERAAAARAASRCRALSALCVSGYLLGALWLAPDARARAELHYAVVVTIGYGHLVGAAVFSGDRLARALPAWARLSWLSGSSPGLPPLLWILVGLASSILFGIYMLALSRAPALALVLLAISSWHTVENDQALASIHARGHSAGPLPRGVDSHLAAVGVTALLLALSAATLGAADPTSFFVPGTLGSPLPSLLPSPLPSPLVTTRLALPIRAVAAVCGGLLILRARRRGAVVSGATIVVASALIPSGLGHHPWLTFSDVFAATSLYHLASWLWLSVAKIRGSGRRPGAVPTLVCVHALPALMCFGLLCAGDSAATAPLAAAYFSPTIYLFWSCLHVGQTLLVREVR
jgi:hypothetical protein